VTENNMMTEETNFSPQTATQDLWRIAETDCVKQVGPLLERGAEINATDVHGVTALMRAAAGGQRLMVTTLLEQGADPNMARNDGFTSLLLASFFGHEEIVRLLVEHGADTTAASRFGTSARMWATSRSFFELADYLEHPETKEDPPNTREVVSAPTPVPITPVTTSPVPQRVFHQPVESWHGFELQEIDLKRYLPTRVRLHWALAVCALALLFVVLIVLTDAMMRAADGPQVTAKPEPISQTSGTLLTPESALTNSIGVKPSQPEKLNNENGIGEKDPLRKPTEVKQLATARTISTNIEASTKQSETEDVPTATKNPESIPTSESSATSKQQPEASPDPKPTKPATQNANQLITGTKNSAPPGKVIRWP